VSEMRFGDFHGAILLWGCAGRRAPPDARERRFSL